MSGTFKVLDARIPEEHAEWLRFWDKWPAHEVHAHPAYSLLFAEESDGVLCAVYVDQDAHVMYPFSLRNLQWLETERGATDTISPYGYGGAFCWGISNEVTAEFSQNFWQAFDAWAASRNVVTELVRFSLFSQNLLDYPGASQERLLNVVVDLQPSEESIWMSFESKVRKNVKKAQRLGVRVDCDTTGEKLDEFLEIYHGTLDRRSATDGYYWQRSFFDAIVMNLPKQFVFFHAMVDERIVSTELVLVSSESIYSFLGGTRSEDFDLRPNDLLKFEIIRWAKTQGKKNFVLGGGAAAGDGIERYKRSFAPQGLHPFSTGQRVLDERSNARLVDAARETVRARGGSWDDTSDYFPRYRNPN